MTGSRLWASNPGRYWYLTLVTGLGTDNDVSPKLVFIQQKALLLATGLIVVEMLVGAYFRITTFLVSLFTKCQEIETGRDHQPNQDTIICRNRPDLMVYCCKYLNFKPRHWCFQLHFINQFDFQLSVLTQPVGYLSSGRNMAFHFNRPAPPHF